MRLVSRSRVAALVLGPERRTIGCESQVASAMVTVHVDKDAGAVGTCAGDVQCARSVEKHAVGEGGCDWGADSGAEAGCNGDGSGVDDGQNIARRGGGNCIVSALGAVEGEGLNGDGGGQRDGAGGTGVTAEGCTCASFTHAESVEPLDQKVSVDVVSQLPGPSEPVVVGGDVPLQGLRRKSCCRNGGL